MTETPRRRWVPLVELLVRCTRCGHQGAVHTKGADRSGWAVYVVVWRNATGGCSTPECPCPERTNDPQVVPLPPAITPEALATLAPLLRPEEGSPLPLERLYGPCEVQPGPCGALPTRPYPMGARCAEHAPGAGHVALREAA